MSSRAGRSVIVLEARERVGGRVYNHVLANGEVSERGAPFIGPTQDHIAALARWAQEEWSRSCPVALFGPGTLLAYGPSLRAPIGRIHWAGTETSNYWAGYMDGAVRSSQRTAREVTEAA